LSGFQVRANNANFKKHVLDAAKQIEDFLLAAGWHTMVSAVQSSYKKWQYVMHTHELASRSMSWRPQVENMEKHWVFEAVQGSLTWK